MKGAWSELLSNPKKSPRKAEVSLGTQTLARPLWGAGSAISELVLSSTGLEPSLQLIAL